MSDNVVTYPWIIRHNYKVEYFDRTPAGAIIAEFGTVYAGHMCMQIETPHEQYDGIVCVEGLELHTAEDYRRLLTDLGYYEEV